ncbi:MAG: zf-HC2 domain-containing protein [Vicinamibacterales bacterium]
MIRTNCGTVRKHLAAYYDAELPVETHIAVEAHLRECVACAMELADLEGLGDTLRAGAGRVPDGVLDGFMPGVVSRMKAEQSESLGEKFNRMFEDLHLVWAALGATCATVASVALMAGIFYYAVSNARPDSLAGLLDAMAAPGSNANPVQLSGNIAFPRGIDTATPTLPMTEEDAVFTLATVLTREGRIDAVELLDAKSSERREVLELLDAISTARFEPATFAGSPVAVRMVWMVAHYTVRGRAPGETRIPVGRPTASIDDARWHRQPALV